MKPNNGKWRCACCGHAGKWNDRRLGMINPGKATSDIDIFLDEALKAKLKKVSRMSNHTLSSVIAVLSAAHIVKVDAKARRKQSAKKKT